jgi:isoleucyl-tRNA synthetase
MARQAKVIGHALDARVTLALPRELQGPLANQQKLLSTVFIVSQVTYANPEEMGNPVDGLQLEGLKIQVELASGVKCERCWVRDETVGSFSEHPAICERCHEVVTHEA